MSDVEISDGEPRMKVGVCGIACERCPHMRRGVCPSGESGCRPKDDPFCKVATCAHGRGIDLCFECPEFPCETTKEGPINYEYCRYIAGNGG